MKTFIMADLHLGKFWKTNNAAFNRAKKMINNYFYNLDTIIEQLNGEPANLIIAGDIYDSIHNNVEFLCYVKNKLSHKLRYFNQRGNVSIVPGNHEVFIDRNGDQGTILTIGLDSYNNNIVNTVSGVTYWLDEEEEINYVLISYTNNIEEVLKNTVMTFLNPNYKNIIIGHFTPKEIFYHSKLELNKYIDELVVGDIKIPYIILGHYHKPFSYTYKDTTVISIGSSYYHTLDDIRDHNNKKLQKRFIVVNDINNVNGMLYKLPKVHEFVIEDQKEYESIHFDDIVNKDEDIIYIKSKVLIDYSQLMFQGYDIYFDLIEDENNNLNNIQQSLTEAISDNISGSTLNDRWNKYINLNTDLNNQEKDIATYLFNRRNDKIDNQEIFKMFEVK